MAAYPENPHISWPFTFGANGVAVVEQDSEEAITACAMLIANTPLGYRPERPEFGWDMPVMPMAPVSLDGLVAALNQFEPRLAATQENVQSLADAALGEANIEIDLAMPSGTATTAAS